MSPTRIVPAVADDEASEPVLGFLVAKSLPYRKRMAWVVGLVVVGAAMQFATMNVLFGVPAIVAAVVLSWVVGYDNRLDRRGLAPETGWQTAPWESVREIVDLDARIVRWDRSALDISSGIGCFTWLAAVGALVLVTSLTAASAGERAAAIVGVDGALLLIPQWFSGMRTVDRQPDLLLKARHLVDVVGAVPGPRVESLGKVRGQLRMIERRGAATPADVRVLILPDGAPETAPLLQGQVVLNRVQGTPYPYFYAVLVQRAGSGLDARAARIARPKGIVVERKTEGGNSIVVVRQETTRTSGYHTLPDVSRRILGVALDIALAAAPAGPTHAGTPPATRPS